MKTPEEVDKEYRAALRAGIWEQREAMYEALTQHTGGCLCRRLAVFALEEIGWSTARFIDTYRAGTIDE